MGTIPVAGVWTHIAVTYALGVTNFYINGSLIGTSIAPSYYYFENDNKFSLHWCTLTIL